MNKGKLDVVTVFSPREGEWKKYLPLIHLQRQSVMKYPGHRHIVVTDALGVECMPALNLLATTLPRNLMKMILAAQLDYLNQWSGEHPAVLVDVDCLVGRNLHEAFDGTFDIGLTRRLSTASPINNGAMYIAAGAREKAISFFKQAYDTCEEHWGGDQEAISRVAAPVPSVERVEDRNGTRISFLSMKTHNVIPEIKGALHKRRPFIIHFKGEHKKDWMEIYFNSWLR